MRKEIVGLVLLGVLGGLTACSGEAAAPPAPPQEPAVSAAPSPEPEETPDGEVQYFDLEHGEVTYLTREAFLTDCGLEGAEPFYTFRMEEEVDLYEAGEVAGTGLQTLCVDLYCDEASGSGCGFWYREGEGAEPVTTGFRFEETADGRSADSEQWNRWEADYFKIPAWEDCFAEDYQEHYEYDEAGRVVSFLADGIYETAWETEQGRNPVFQAEFFYDEGGNILRRDFSQFVFGTAGMSQRSYFDEAGRVFYEWSYITHGEVEYFYFYEGDSREPAYGLFLDHNSSSIWAEFAKY